MQAIVADRGSLQKHVSRYRIVLLTAAELGTNAIMRAAGVAKTAVWRWQERLMHEDVDGRLRDQTRPPGKSPLPQGVVDRVVALTQSDPPGETRNLAAPAVAEAAGISVSSVQRTWKTPGLAPHRFHRFKLSNDPHFAAKLREIAGLDVDPPAHVMVLSLDEKSQIQALDRTQPGLPMRKDQLGTMTHDHKRNGTMTLFAALNVLDGSIIGRCMQRHRHQLPEGRRGRGVGRQAH